MYANGERKKKFEIAGNVHPYKHSVTICIAFKKERPAYYRMISLLSLRHSQFTSKFYLFLVQFFSISYFFVSSFFIYGYVNFVSERFTTNLLYDLFLCHSFCSLLAHFKFEQNHTISSLTTPPPLHRQMSYKSQVPIS